MGSKRTYAYDPHLDPQLGWAGKAERTSFDVPTVSLHVHERIDPRTIIEAVRRQEEEAAQFSLFESSKENPPIREAIEFYKHRHNWTNRLIAGDSILVMNSLLEKEGMGGSVQMIYIDPPYGIRYGSNFQPFVNRRDVKDGKDEDLTSEPETIKAFRDTWELGIHSYLTYLRDRLLLARELLHESGSIFVQISDENVHLVRNLMDEVLGRSNFVSQIAFQTTPYATSNFLAPVYDTLLWYGKEVSNLKFNSLFLSKEQLGKTNAYRFIESPDGSNFRTMTQEEMDDKSRIPAGWKRFQSVSLISQGATSTAQEFEFGNRKWTPPANSHWKVTIEGLKNVEKSNRIFSTENSLRFKSYITDFPLTILHNIWTDMITGSFTEVKRFVVQTNPRVIERCILMTTNPGDLVFDPTCGSGTTAFVAEQWGRRWITCDTSRVATTLARGRLMTALFDYYHLARPDEGVGSGFRYKTVPHVTLGSIANNEPPAQETLYDLPLVDRSRVRVASPFTVEAVPAPVVASISEMTSADAPPVSDATAPADASIARSGETLRQQEWRDELSRAGIRTRGGERLNFSRVEPLAGTRWLHADAELQTAEGDARRAVISFGQAYAPLEQRQVNRALEEANKLFPRPAFVIFAAFQFDPEAAKDIDETVFPGVTLLKAQMNADMLTDDLKKKRASNESFWLIGQPDVTLHELAANETGEKQYKVEVAGFDYYNTRTGSIESGGKEKIALWMLDTDYDGRSLFPRQVFFPLAGDKDGWARLAKNLKAQIDEDLIEAYRGTISLPFTAGENRRLAVKIVDDRGIESLKLIDL